MSDLRSTHAALAADPQTWLVTGAAGFIGSNLVEALLMLDQRVVGLDSFATGFKRNLEEIRQLVTPRQWERFRSIEGDVRDMEACRSACQDVRYVLHQAALGSVPRSIEDPRTTHECNVTGQLNMLLAARDAGVDRFIYASSSSIYGDDPELPNVEQRVGLPLSPYAASKHAAELYAHVFSCCYGLRVIGLRYFNVFGPRQDPQGAYAAVIPRWIAAAINREPLIIYGDGLTTRDFCPVANIVDANLIAATVRSGDALDRVYNIALGQATSLNELAGLIREKVQARTGEPVPDRMTYQDHRPGDIRHSRADISLARRLLGYNPAVDVSAGLDVAVDWYVAAGARK